jgi:hypothetical protein
MVATATVVGVGAAVGGAIGGVTSAIEGGNILQGIGFGALGGAVTGGIGSALGGATGSIGDVFSSIGDDSVGDLGASAGVDAAGQTADTGLGGVLGTSATSDLSLGPTTGLDSSFNGSIGSGFGGNGLTDSVTSAAVDSSGTPLTGAIGPASASGGYSDFTGALGANGTDVTGSFLGNSGATGLTDSLNPVNSLTSGINFGDSSGLSSAGSGSSLLGNIGNQALQQGTSSFLSPQLLSGATNALGSYFASANQEAAANNASAVSLNEFGQMQTNLLPFIQAGQGANSALVAATGLNTANPLNSPLLQAPTQSLSLSALQQTPGYQFALQQGLESTQNGFAAQGLGSSGSALKGAANYATGLAENTYQQQYQNAVTNQQNQYNRLISLSQLGQNSAANLGAQGVQTASNVGSNIVGAANAGSAAIMSGANNIGNAALAYPYLNASTNNLNSQSNYYNSLLGSA